MYSEYTVLPIGLSFSSVFSVKPEPISTLWFFLSTIPDPRRPQGTRHPLPIVLLLAILALCCGYTSYQAMEEWSKNYQELLREQLSFVSGHTPDAATFYRVFASIDVGAFEEILGNWLQAIIPVEDGEGIAIDGKTISGTGVHLVAAFTHKLQTVLFEMGTDVKGKELVVGPQVIDHIPVKNHVLTGDAMFTQKKICEQITKQHGGYVFTVKGNQGNMEEALRMFFADPPWKVAMPTHKTIDCWKGRKERRTLRMSDDAQLLSYLNWPGLTHVWECTRVVTRKGITTTESAVGIAHLLPQHSSAEKLNRYIREHWSIENGLHRQRDVVFHEDKATNRNKPATQMMAALKNLVISIFHRATVRAIPTAFRRFASHPQELFSFLGLPE
ncbi:MAG: ISAs1 family transposase, partial [Rhabdochlamydiaceae bacterium]